MQVPDVLGVVDELFHEILGVGLPLGSVVAFRRGMVIPGDAERGRRVHPAQQPVQDPFFQAGFVGVDAIFFVDRLPDVGAVVIGVALGVQCEIDQLGPRSLVDVAAYVHPEGVGHVEDTIVLLLVRVVAGGIVVLHDHVRRFFPPEGIGKEAAARLVVTTGVHGTERHRVFVHFIGASRAKKVVAVFFFLVLRTHHRGKQRREGGRLGLTERRCFHHLFCFLFGIVLKHVALVFQIYHELFKEVGLLEFPEDNVQLAVVGSFEIVHGAQRIDDFLVGPRQKVWNERRWDGKGRRRRGRI
mmetsp:Transcript_120945/g.247097  ORF Transcript_120945/g.247097 Transcript_120945/m.247097 type:complete len:299 (-) Transcript_120945:334-1230(-)